MATPKLPPPPTSFTDKDGRLTAEAHRWLLLLASIVRELQSA